MILACSFFRYDHDHSGTICNTDELQLLIVKAMYACQDRGAKWRTDESAQHTVPGLLRIMKHKVRTVTLAGIAVSNEHQWTLEAFVNYFDTIILEKKPALSLVVHSNPLMMNGTEPDQDWGTQQAQVLDNNSIVIATDQGLMETDDLQHAAEPASDNEEVLCV